MVVVTGGASCWVIADGRAGPTGIYQMGTIDVLGLAVMVVALIGAFQAASHARCAGSALQQDRGASTDLTGR